MRVFYSPDYVACRDSIETCRKAEWIADSLIDSPIFNVEIVEPALLTAVEIADVHAPEYVRAVETGRPQDLAESQGFCWDKGLWRMVLASNGGVVAAALTALDCGVAGSLSSGMHHARYGYGDGFCTFNGLVIAAKAALLAGAKSVLILDLDAHCGGGTAALIAGEPRIRQVDIAVNSVDCYLESDQSQLTVVTSATRYLATIRQQLDETASRGKFDLCLYNAGMDPHEDCSTGGLPGISRAVLAERERLVFEWCRRRRLPVAFALAGGYLSRLRLTEADLVHLHRLTLTAASRDIV